MLRNYLKVAFRNIFKNKTYVIINILGMGLAVSFCLTIYMLFAFNNEFDNYYKNTSNIYRVHEFKQHASGEIQRFELAPMPLGPRVKNELTGISDQTRFTNWYENIKYEEDIFREGIAYVDSNFFELFPIKLKSGTYNSLNDKNNIFLTQELAKKLFGEDQAIGKLLTVHYSAEKKLEFKVAGVFERIPMNSSFDFRALTLNDNFLYGRGINAEDWTAWQQTTLFLKLEENVNPAEVEKNLTPYVAIQNEAREEWKISNFELVGFKDASKVNQGMLSGSNTSARLRNEVMIVFGSMALLILLIACFNLANTSIALMSKRIREIGVRKVMGGGTRQIFIQFLLEMAWTSGLAILLGLALSGYVTSEFYALWDIPIETGDFSTVNLGIAVVILFLLTTFMAGFYPAIYSNKFQPAVIFRNQIKLRSSGIVSKVLNGLQFAFSIIVLIAGIAFTQNAEFIKMLDYGYDQDGLIVMYVDNAEEYRMMRDKAENQTGITDLAGTQNHYGYSYEDTFLKLDSGNVEVRSLKVGDNYLELIDLKLLDGRLFNRNMESDYAEGVIVNQEYVDRFNLQNPIGQMVNIEEGKKYIVGVVGNVIEYVWSDSKIIPKLYLPVREEDNRMLIVKAKSENREEVFNYLSDSWKEIIPDRQFTGRYQDEVAFGNALSENNNMKIIFLALAILGSLLSLTGIFALSSLNVSSKFKEIGIRKVMGASSKNILLQLNKGFLIIMTVATLVGAILGYFVTSAVLSIMYSYFITIGIGTLLISGMAILLVAMLTTSATIISAANTNPSHILRDE